MPADQAARLTSWLVAAEGLDAHVFVLTSGTTASSEAEFKWVALSKEAILASAEASNSRMGVSEGDAWVHCLPSFHVGGIGIWARAMLSESEVRILPRWSAEGFVALARGATLASLVPAQVHDLVQAGLSSPPSLRAILVGGGALSDGLYVAARELGWPLLRTYGMSETASQTATEPLVGLGPARYRVLPHLEVRAGEDNRLMVRGSSLMTGYVSLDSLGQPHLWDPKDADGWFTTEDLGEVEGDWLTLSGRSADRIKIGGEIANLYLLGNALDVACAGRVARQSLELLALPDPRLESVVALIAESDVPQDQLDEVVAAFDASVMPFERLRRVFRVDAIPRSELGKAKRAELLALVSGR